MHQTAAPALYGGPRSGAYFLGIRLSQANTRHLDRAQSAAAKGTAAIQLTLAGPGAGKTSTLTGRFIYLVSKGADPARILAMTYTKKAADELRTRIVRLLEQASAEGLHIATFHAFAFRELKRDPAAAGLKERFALWNTPEQRQVFNARRMWWNGEEGHSRQTMTRRARGTLDRFCCKSSVDGRNEQ
ncbi:MAG: UvrD-helicase domain-containing protein [Rhodomicrobium sp.]